MTPKLTRLQAAEQAAEIAETKARAAREKLQALRKEQDRKEKIAARKARNNALFQVGGLVEIAGLLDADKGALLGALLDAADTLQQGPESPHFQQWKPRGDALLAERERNRKKPDTVTDKTDKTAAQETPTDGTVSPPG